MATTSIYVAEDTVLNDDNPNTNYSAEEYLIVGELNDGVNQFRRSILKPSFTGIPTGAVFSTATLNLTVRTDKTGNDRYMYAYRVLRPVTISQATWNKYNSTSSWTTAGCDAAGNDYDSSAFGNCLCPAAPTIGSVISMSLSASEMQKFFNGTYSNYGLLLKMDTEYQDATYYYSREDSGGRYPYLTITYTVPEPPPPPVTFVPSAYII